MKPNIKGQEASTGPGHREPSFVSQALMNLNLQGASQTYHANRAQSQPSWLLRDTSTSVVPYRAL
jgi:hypothetical protein